MSETVGELFAHHVRRQPQALAVRTPGRTWTYAELGRDTARLAHRLHARGAGPGTVVAMPIQRGPHALIGLLAVIRAGAACLPMDPNGPPERNREVLLEAGCALVLTEADVILDDPGDLPAGEGLPVPGPQDLAYAITTSGSTGRPKVVGVPHAAIVNCIRACRYDLDLIRPDDVVLWTAAPTVDVTMQDCLMALACGAAVAIPAPGELQGTRLVRDARELGATVLDLPAALVGPYGRALLPRLAAAGVRLVITGSSQLDGRGLADAAGAMVVHNGYGPTEAAVAVTWYRCDPATPQRTPIGRPIRGVRIHLLDDDGREVAAGQPGQVCIAGPALARGYLGRPARTAAAFLPDPLADVPGGRMYATGDRAMLGPDGNLVYLGRLDDQVKVDGHRVEIGEVEHALRDCPGVIDAAILIHERAPGGTAIVAYLTGAPSADEDLVNILRDRLPSYMLPRFYVWLDMLPLNRPGKVDRAKLAEMPITGMVMGAGRRDSPRTSLKEIHHGG
ncbi:amino acid adenylation domain-containing protein [Dactylosporangium sp. CS-033363]|uniref:amino acid adenylation domain-containing protein n=1 Tax=Dactylosporangium sp. CS-033363 TaxID=3239935 RepID=UPI003D92B221